jgi:hypothetical protein
MIQRRGQTIDGELCRNVVVVTVRKNQINLGEGLRLPQVAQEGGGG